ncbi:E3 ubiquitin-protein ligase RNF186 [Sceloporus undulatus]|uniref:E3 ubiquitin-protein ligase RNF186 n=1 Tax=Sceloporus undulatus TaxID=8520 RepID=UPI001C4B36A4|nr:E3 ubiquitin-protein ligase RNF186 [Sceloporus undulatus]
MAGLADDFHIEKESFSPAAENGPAKEDGPEMEKLETAQGSSSSADSDPGCETCPGEEERPCSPCARADPNGTQLGASDVPLSVPLPAVVAGSTDLSKTSPDESCRQPPRLSLAEMDCLICFNRYSPCRMPKVLACQHAFCAVCLKLLLRNEDRTWVIGCPLCRKATVVFGGLVCSLQNKEDVVGWLETPDLDAEACHPPEPPSEIHTRHPTISENREPAAGGTNRGAAKRLVLLLFLVAVLIIFILPFLYTGLLKWALSFVVLLGLVISVLLCCNPSWHCPSLALPSWRKKENPVAASIA